MKRFILFFILACTTASFAYPQKWNRINAKIAHMQERVDHPKYIGDEKNKKLNIKIFKEVRKHWKILQKMNINTNNDTVFILDYHVIGNPLLSVIWTCKQEKLFTDIDTDSFFDEDRGKLQMDSLLKNGVELYRDDFTQQCIVVPVSKWDIDTIRWWERNGEEYVQETTIYLTRIIFREHKRELYDCIRFRNYPCE